MPGNKGAPDAWIALVDVPGAVIVPGRPSMKVDADHAVCITAPQLFAQALPRERWPAQPGQVPLAARGRWQRLAPEAQQAGNEHGARRAVDSAERQRLGRDQVVRG